MEPFNAPGPAPASRERLDRLRERTAAPPPRAPRTVAPWVLSAALLAFALGLIANPWFERRVRSQLPGFAEAVPASPEVLAAQQRSVAALQARVAALEIRSKASSGAAPLVGPVPANEGERLARLEARLDNSERTAPASEGRMDKLAGEIATLTGRVDASAAATQATLTSATTAADRAQTVLLLAATRRALEGGARLGTIEPALRRQLGAANPQPVEAIAALGAAPVTLASLRQGFDTIRPQLGGAPVASAPATGWLASLSATFDSMVHVRDASPGNPTEVRVERAAAALRSGDVTTARDQLAALPAPARARATGWLTAADRYLAGMRSLAALESAALMTPR